MPVAGTARTKINSIVFASCFGTIIEWYDFLIYATAAALVFNKAFFPTFDPLAGTLAALGSYAVGFAARPLGAALASKYPELFKSVSVAYTYVQREIREGRLARDAAGTIDLPPVANVIELAARMADA